jgi:hypothetical protein
VLSLSDGEDNTSDLSLGKLRERLGASNVTIYAVSIRPPISNDVGPAFANSMLRNLTVETG